MNDYNRQTVATSQTVASPAERLSAAVEYFRSHPGLQRLLEGLIEKYRSLGRLGGTIELPDINLEERAALEGFFRQRFDSGRVRLTAGQFTRALAATRFEGLDPVDLLAAWQGAAVLSRREQREAQEQERQNLLAGLASQFLHPACQAWLQAMSAKQPETRVTQRAYLNDRDFAANLTTALRALADLPQQYQHLPVFARRICGDPHGLDPDRPAGKLFLEGLRYLQTNLEAASEADLRSTTEELNELLYRGKLLRDDVLNFATCFGLTAATGSAELLYWRKAAEVGAPLNIPLRELIRVASLRPYTENLPFSDESTAYTVFVVENSGIFSALLETCITAQKPLVCLHGQFKLASWALLDRLVQSGAQIHYSGDFDPEGLQMAQKLLLRYPGRCKVWRMSAADYRQAMPSVTLDETRLRKLVSITAPELETLAQAIAATGMAAYQEGLLEELAADLEGTDKR